MEQVKIAEAAGAVGGVVLTSDPALSLEIQNAVTIPSWPRPTSNRSRKRTSWKPVESPTVTNWKS